ncbi:hypothetical protein [Terriglobus sp. TAA 43]|uniref:hypothetical protein n=1 Tax=Terriglobus sp. TAA 43 TaxID=278961 RepID=UPI00064786D6|nr:hypothetical protein [Terriglobus sp. TAA 43]
MIRDTIERLWRRVIVATGVSAVSSLILMAVTGHDQGPHDTGFGIVLYLVLFIGTVAFLFLFSLYILYAIVMHFTER